MQDYMIHEDAVDNDEEHEVGKRNVGASLIELNRRTSELLANQM